MTTSQGPYASQGGEVPIHQFEDLWYVQREAEAEGPFTGHVLQEKIKAGAVGAASLVAKVGATQWTAIVDVPAFASALPAPAAVRYAGFWIRLFAAVIDVLLLFGLLNAVSTITSLIVVTAGTAVAAESAWILQGLGPLLFLLGALPFYFIYFPSSVWQATPGKWICGLHIVRTDGSFVEMMYDSKRPSASAPVTRLLLIGFLLIAVTREKKGLHDIICGGWCTAGCSARRRGRRRINLQARRGAGPASC
jgi:uncharacterized RDD family membrane protein YckC